MTKVTIYKNHKKIYTGFDCLGHSGFAENGEDIVCAGISVLVINTINSIENLTNNSVTAESDEESGMIRFRFHKDCDEAGKLLIDAMVLGLEGIQQNYGNSYLYLNFKEV